ncbi:MAG: hypothetical protein WBZ33_16520, partial [Thermoactinomyces sp.]
AKITGLSKSVVQNLKGELYVSQGFHYKESVNIRILTSEPYTKSPPLFTRKITSLLIWFTWYNKIGNTLIFWSTGDKGENIHKVIPERDRFRSGTFV